MELVGNQHKTFISADGTQLYYEKSPVSESPCSLILLHGLGGDLRSWDKERVLFKEMGYTTYALDLRGHGRSQKAVGEDAYAMERLASDVAELVRLEHPRKPVIVGHCLGGMVAMTVEAFHPGTAESLVLVDTSFKPSVVTDKFYSTTWLRRVLPLIARWVPRHRAYNVNLANLEKTTDFDVRRIASDILRTSLRDYLQICQQILGFDGEKALSKIKLPTLVVTGSKDPVFPPELAEELAKRIPNAQLAYVADATHIIVLNNPLELVTEIDMFLRESRVREIK